MDYTELAIVEKIVELSDKYRKLESIQGMPGHAQVTEINDFKITYISPFSGVEVLPGIKHYIVSIWTKNKKIFNCDYKGLDDINNKKPIAKDWVIKFMRLN